MHKGKLIFTFYGAKLKGEFTLLKMHGQEKNWLIIKTKDSFADANWKLETVFKENIIASKNET
jgi:bifunctional non-homologous end joining protein LigD